MQFVKKERAQKNFLKSDNGAYFADVKTLTIKPGLNP
jgi:hypothetical protein